MGQCIEYSAVPESEGDVLSTELGTSAAKSEIEAISGS